MLKNIYLILCMLMTSTAYTAHRPLKLTQYEELIEEDCSLLERTRPHNTQASRNAQSIQDKLISATMLNDIEKAQLAIQQGADVNARDIIGSTPLINAINHANVEIVKWLVRHGADISKPDADGLTPIEYVQEQIEHYQNRLKQASEQKEPNKERISDIRATIEKLNAISLLVSPTAPAPAAPPAPMPTISAQAAPTAGSSASSSTASAPGTAGSGVAAKE